MLEDKPKYITNLEAYKKIASEVGVSERAVRNVIRYFFNFIFRYARMQKKITILGFGTVKTNDRSKYFVVRRRKVSKLFKEHKNSKPSEISKGTKFNQKSLGKL
jgi:nucleoid DNA-binding protein